MFTAIIFAESGFFLPGDSLLFAAEILSAAGYFDIRLIIFLAVIAAILGFRLEYYTRGHFGKWLLNLQESWWWKKSHLTEAEEFYKNAGLPL